MNHIRLPKLVSNESDMAYSKYIITTSYPHECKFWYKANICNTCPIKANICNMKAKSCNKVCCRYLPYLDRLLQLFPFMLQIFALFGQVLHFFPFKS